jgi:hypothetical protein
MCFNALFSWSQELMERSLRFTTCARLHRSTRRCESFGICSCKTRWLATPLWIHQGREPYTVFRRIRRHLPHMEALGLMFVTLVARTSSRSKSPRRVRSALLSVQAPLRTSNLVRRPHSLLLLSLPARPDAPSVEAAQAIDPPPYPHLALLGTTSTGTGPDYSNHNVFIRAKAARILGLGAELPCLTMTECTRDCLADFKARGWQP